MSRLCTWRWSGQELQRLGVLALAYAGLGMLSQCFAIPPGYAPVIWLPAGLTLGAFLLWGYRVWPGIVLGAMALQLWTALHTGSHATMLMTVGLAGSLALGATLQGLLGAMLLQRYVGFPNALDQAKPIARLLGLGGLLSCLVSATVGVISLWAAGIIPSALALANWCTWWLGNTLGVLVITPGLLISMTALPHVASPRRRAVMRPLVIALVLTMAVFAYMHEQEQARIQRRLARQAEALSQTLLEDMQRAVDRLTAIGSLYASVADVNRQTFGAFVQAILARQPGLQALEWVPRVRHDERPAYEEAGQRDGYSAFQFTEFQATGQRVRAAQRPEYFPVYYREPSQGNETVLGFDLGSHPARLAALSQTRDSGRPHLTEPLTLLYGGQSTTGLLLMLPLYQHGRPHDTEEQRRQHLRGFVLGVFRLHDVLQAALQAFDLQSLHLQIKDQTAPTAPRVLYTSHPAADAPDPGEHAISWEWESTIEVGGRRWRLCVTPALTYLAAQQNPYLWAIIAAGFLGNGLLGGFLLLTTARTSTVEHLVTARTEALTQANAALQQSEERYRALIDQAANAILILDQHGNYIDVNRRGIELLGYSREALLQKRLGDLSHPGDLEAFPIQLESLQRGDVVMSERRLIRQDGSLIPVEMSSKLLPDGRLQIIVRDITARQQAAAALAEQHTLALLAADIGNTLNISTDLQSMLQRCAAQLLSHLDAALVRIWTLQEATDRLELQASAGLYTHRDGAHSRIAVGQWKIGRIAAERRPHQSNDVCNDPDVHDQAWARAAGLLAFAGYPLLLGERLQGVVALFARQPLSSTTLAGLARISDALALGIARLEAVAAVQAEKILLQTILDSLGEGVVVADTSGRFLAFNPEAQRLVGRGPEALPDPEQWSQLYGVFLPDTLTLFPAAQLPLARAIRGEAADRVEMFIRSATVPDGRWLSGSGRPMYAADGTVRAGVVTLIDITARRDLEESLRLALAEQETLLREVHHRVKNNMQVISSLLRLQSGYLDDPQARSLFEECQDRVHSMALIHEWLYRSPTLARLDFSAYLRELTGMLVRSYGAQQVHWQVEAETVPLDLDTAIPLGLILNELVTNALKHAFPAGRAGRLSIRLGFYAEDRLSLTVQDDGCGFPDVPTWNTARSLGLRLVHSLTRQLHGTVTLHQTAGTEIRLVFPVAPLSPLERKNA